jgi:lantibiotic biosynthesis protein
LIDTGGVDQGFDVLSGFAGSIPVLLAMADDLRMSPLSDLAVRFGDQLCDQAQWHGDVCVWESDGKNGKFGTPLAGFSHGASGIAVSLLALYSRLGEQRFLRTARGSFKYEDTLFRSSEKNWSDVRFVDGAPSAAEEKFVSAWCHGAPGIGMARLLSAALDQEMANEYIRTGTIAISTTSAALKAAMATSNPDVSLCHGVAGLSEILNIASPYVDCAEECGRAAAFLVESIRNISFRSGVPSGGPNPSLMLGSAGVAHHLLRLAYPSGTSRILILPS